jgi:hypothetical protein
VSPLLIALVAMFLQQTFASVGKVLPAVIARLVIAELNEDPAWVGVYYGVAAAASLVQRRSALGIKAPGRRVFGRAARAAHRVSTGVTRSSPIIPERRWP